MAKDFYIKAGSGGVASVSASAPLSSSGGSTPTISISQANTSTNGYLSATDWNTFNAKQAALVSGTNIKTVNSTSILGSGNIAVEPTITAGTTSQYWRGDKSWQTLDKTAVGLSNVDNTSDASKPISTATQTALDAKGYMLAGNLNGTTVGLGVTTYIGFGVGSTSTNISQRNTVVSEGTVKGVYLRTNASMTGTLVLTVMKNGSATSMTFTIATGSAAGLYSTTSNQFTVADGDELSIRIAQSTATSSALYGFSIMVK